MITAAKAILIVITLSGIQCLCHDRVVESFPLNFCCWNRQRGIRLRRVTHIENVEFAVAVQLSKHIYHPSLF
ncbi:hypothetical protein EA472_20075 [Natrarchaeobius oligotrophus]|uniref:Uncharacterized protein n=1 Tax=Natrarchaeobius chitinivorans TaxID=1679083 RepID=A0A3N6M869_NATCH|nr:hypothetical protein EA472_20075 [Natrarchaeobius chitinivorans]